MIRDIVLHGRLKEFYADPIKLDVDSVAEAIRGLSFQLKGFKEALREGHYEIHLDRKRPQNTIPAEMLHFELGGVETIHIIPVLEGAKGGGGKIIAGIALVALSFALPGAGTLIGSAGLTTVNSAALGATLPGLFVTNLTIAKFGAAMIFSGIASVLSKPPKAQKAAAFERADERPSFLYDGPVNTTEQGGPVPLVYGGPIRVGSQVVSAGLTTENR